MSESKNTKNNEDETINSIDKWKEAIKDIFGVRLPVAGGFGLSMDDAVIIETDDSGFGVSTEYEFLKYLHMGGGIGYKIVEQQVFEEKGKAYDKITVIRDTDPDKKYDFYFDISKFYLK